LDVRVLLHDARQHHPGAPSHIHQLVHSLETMVLGQNERDESDGAGYEHILEVFATGGV